MRGRQGKRYQLTNDKNEVMSREAWQLSVCIKLGITHFLLSIPYSPTMPLFNSTWQRSIPGRRGKDVLQLRLLVEIPLRVSCIRALGYGVSRALLRL